MGRRCSEAADFFDVGDGVSGTDCSSRPWSSLMGSGALGVSLRVGVFLMDWGLLVALGLEAVLEPEALRPLEPSLGGDLFTAGEDILLVFGSVGEVEIQTL